MKRTSMTRFWCSSTWEYSRPHSLPGREPLAITPDTGLSMSALWEDPPATSRRLHRRVTLNKIWRCHGFGGYCQP